MDSPTYIVDFLVNMSLPCAWLLFNFKDKCYSFSFIMPYTSFFQFNSHSYTLQVPYYNHSNDQICVQEGFFTNTFIGNLHYFAETCFALFELHSFLSMPQQHQDSITQGWLSKEQYRLYWHSRNGIGRKHQCFHPIQPGLEPGPWIFFLLSGCKFIVDDIFADLL